MAAKWLIPERYTDKADSLLRDFINQDVELIAPDLIVGKIGNALWKRSVLIRDISVDYAREAYRAFGALGLPLHPSSGIAARALTLAVQEQHRIYDALYVALAEAQGCEFITADEKLVSKMSGKFSFIRSLGDF